MANKENIISKRIMLALSEAQSTLFRNNVGQAWVGKCITNRNGSVILENARPFHAGLCKGSSDLIGWTEVEIKQEHVGKKLAVFTAVEVKTASGRATGAQSIFIENVRKAGGLAGIARDEKSALKIIE